MAIKVGARKELRALFARPKEANCCLPTICKAQRDLAPDEIVKVNLLPGPNQVAAQMSLLRAIVCDIRGDFST